MPITMARKQVTSAYYLHAKGEGGKAFSMHYLAQGLTQKEIGELIGISENAVKKHITKIYFKIGAANRANAIHIATANGLVDVIGF